MKAISLISLSGEGRVGGSERDSEPVGGKIIAIILFSCIVGAVRREKEEKNVLAVAKNTASPM